MKISLGNLSEGELTPSFAETVTAVKRSDYFDG